MTIKNLLTISTLCLFHFSIPAFAADGAGKAKELPGNLIPNGGFESRAPESQKPGDWNPANPAAVNSVTEVVKDPAGAHSGTSYLKVQAPTEGGAASFSTKDNIIPLPDKEYEFVVWVRGSGTFRQLVSQYAENKFVSSVGPAKLSSAGPEWESHTLEYMKAEEIENVRLMLQCTGEVQFDSAWFGPKK